MTEITEQQRIVQVYRDYTESKTVQARWNTRNRGNQAILEERRLDLAALIRSSRTLPPTLRVLEVGCGSGGVLAELRDTGVRPMKLYGIDLLLERVAVGAAKNPQMNFAVADGTRLPFDDSQFDLVLFFTVFSSILDQKMALNVADEANRVLEPGGAVLWYDLRYNNPSNTQVRGVSYETIRRLFQGFYIELHEITLLPPLARRLGAATALIYPLLSRISFLKTHYIGMLVKS